MAEGLTKFIRASMRQPFKWGEHDCAMFCANWVAAVTGLDTARHWRGRYHSEAEARAFINGAGGLVALIDKGTAGTLERCDPDKALVGVINTQRGEVGAVRSGWCWVVLTEKGIGRVRLDLAATVAAWGLPCQRS